MVKTQWAVEEASFCLWAAAAATDKLLPVGLCAAGKTRSHQNTDGYSTHTRSSTYTYSYILFYSHFTHGHAFFQMNAGKQREREEAL